MKEMSLTENKSMTAGDVQAQVNLIQQVMKQVMKENVHYGKIPGCGDKPTLLKPGADKISMTFKFGAEYDEIPGCVESDDYFCYKINCRLIHIPTGKVVGSGRGVCNSKEKKYRTRSVWANKATDAEKEMGTLVDGKYPRYIIPQDPHDIQNTLYKMACKRAHIAAVLTATAASDIFTQDVEDLPAGTIEEEPQSGKPEVEQPKKTTKKVTPKVLREQMTKAFKNEKKRLGDDKYFKFIGGKGFEKVEDISVDEGRKLIVELRKIKAEEKTDENA